VPVVLGLGDAQGTLEVFVGQLRVDDLMTVLDKEGRLHAARDGLPAVKEEDFHGAIVAMPGGRKGVAVLQAVAACLK